mgnify:CR=1 FL=1
MTMEPLPASARRSQATTIADVARRAGVGVGTVSRVLNRSPLVRDSTRARVLEVIEELQYTPSSVARRLSLGRTLTIAVVVPFLTRPAAVERMRGIIAGLRQTAYDVVVFDVETTTQRGEQLQAASSGDRTDGAIVVSLEPTDDDVARFERSGVRAVLVDARHPALPSVVIDDVHGGRLATQHLLDLGHRRIGFVGDLPDPAFRFTSSSDRLHGHLDALTAADVEHDPGHVRTGVHGRVVARGLALELLSADERPTAIFAASDTQALGVLEAAGELGLEVPGELSVIGFDDIEIASYLGLTTVRQPLFESGLRGAEHLLRALAGEAAAAEETLALAVVARRTTGPPP